MRMEKLTKAVLGGMALGALAAGTLAGNVSAAENTVRPQTIVMTDGEVDDMDSFMRFLYIRMMSMSEESSIRARNGITRGMARERNSRRIWIS